MAFVYVSDVLSDLSDTGHFYVQEALQITQISIANDLVTQ